MPLDLIVLFLFFGLLAGALIGCVGVGGVVLVPLLTYLGGTDIRIAIAAAMFAYLISGAVGTWVFARQKSIRWDMTGWMWFGAMPAALAGALSVQFFSAGLLELCIGLLTIGSGWHALLRQRKERLSPQSEAPSGKNTEPLARGTSASIGAVTGFLSALTGTGGPLVLIPILLWFQVPVLAAVGLAQAIQLPIAVLATAGNLYTGNLVLLLGVVLGIGILFGTWAGARLAHALPQATLRSIVSVILVAVGGLILLKLGVALIS